MFLGSTDCSADAKGRFLFPMVLLKQLPPAVEGRFVITRGFGMFLILYPVNAWEKLSAEISQLNLYKQKERDFVRYFTREATHVALDGSNRLLLPRNLLEFAGIKKDIKLCSLYNQIEIWDKQRYEETMSKEPEDFSGLVEDVMGRLGNTNNS